MKRHKQWTWMAVLIGLMVFSGSVHDVARAQTGQEDQGKPGTLDITKYAGYVEDVTFAAVGGKERVTISVSKQSGVSVESQAGNAVLVKMDNMYIPENMRKPLGVGALANLIRVVPVQRSDKGNLVTALTIELGKKVPYSVRQEGNNVIIDFNVAALPDTGKPMSEAGLEPAAVAAVAAPPAEEGLSRGATRGEFTAQNRVIDLDFQDGDVKMILRLLAEEGRVNIVYGDDVAGKVTVNLKGVSWEQVLDTILDIKSLTKNREGNVITVMTNERRKKIVEEMDEVEQKRIKADDARKEREQKLLAEQGMLRQISIEAKIVEVSTDFSRQLGFTWGYGYKDRWNNRDYGFLAGTGGSKNSTTTSLPGTGIGLTASNLAVNFPSSSAAIGPAMGLVVGSSKFILDAKLEALESTGNGKIISSPKVMTMDNVEAKIGQGEEIPYIVRDKEGNSTVDMKEAKLSLKVKPKITAEGKISMEIETEKKAANWARTNLNNENPPLESSDMRSKVVVNDGDTVVIGGIYTTDEAESLTGVPGLSRIPVLGWLFKSTSKTKIKKEILIFVTPRIVKEG